MLKVRARTGYKLAARVDGRTVALRRIRPGVHALRLPLGNLEPGAHSFGVVAKAGRRRASDDATFIVPGDKARVLRVLRAKGTPIAVRVRLPKPATYFRAYLNGTRVDRRFGRPNRRGIRAASLSPSDGLRFGANRLRLLAYRPDGSYARVTRRIRVPRTHGLAAAGVDRQIRPRQRIRLDGRAARAERRDAALAYRWTIVTKPKGSNPRLTGARTARPRFEPDGRGTYKVRLRVFERAKRRASGSTTYAAAGPPSDSVTLTAVPPVPPLGVPINTFVPASGSQTTPQVVIGGGDSGVPATSYPIPSQQALVIDIDPTTLAVKATGSFSIGQYINPCSQCDFYNFIEAIPDGDIVVVSFGGAPTCLGCGSLVYPIATFTELIGAEGLPQATIEIAANPMTPFSIVGTRGAQQGQAYQWAVPPDQAGPYPNPGITGYLTYAAPTATAPTPQFTFVPSDEVAFTMAANGSATIGCTPTTSVCVGPTPPVTSPGFSLVVLDAYTLELKSVTSFGIDANSLNALGNVLNSYGQDMTSLILFRSVGGPAPPTGDWSGMAANGPAVGIPAQTINNLNPAGAAAGGRDFGLVGGGQNLWWPFAPVIDPEVKVGGNAQQPLVMNGVLSRGEGWQFQASQLAPLQGYPSDLAEIAFQPQQAFPYSDDGGPYSAAEAYIADQLFCAGQSPSCQPPANDIRSLYWSGNYDWDSLQAGLAQIDYPSPAPSSFTSDQLNDLKTQFATVEWPAVSGVSQMITHLYSPFTATSGEQQVNVTTIAGQIQAKLPKPKADVTAEIIDTIGDVVGIASEGFSFFAAGTAQAKPAQDPFLDQNAAVTGALSYVFSLISTWTKDENGNALLDQITADSSDIENQVAGAITQAAVGFENLRELLVSDYGKLLAAYDFANDDIPWNSQQLDAATANLTIGARQLAWKSLMRAGFKYDCHSGLVKTPSVTQFNRLQTLGAPHGTLEWGGVQYDIDASSSLMNAMFAPYGVNDSGINGNIDPEDFWMNTMLPPGPPEPWGAPPPLPSYGC